LKTLIDYTLSIIAIVVLIPLFIFHALIILIFSGERPFYTQERALGKNDSKLMIYKLRTIKNISEIKHKNNDTLQKNISAKSYLPLGKLLRKTGLDETSQLLNILMGKMSLIGPRP
jgi:O-antigen biosynthesis protein WbqP